MRRGGIAGMLLPLLLAASGGALILIGQVPIGPGPAGSLAPISLPPSAVAVASPTPLGSVRGSASQAPIPSAFPTNIPANWTATQLQIESVGINVRVRTDRTGQYLDDCCAFVVAESTQPGHGTNSYIAAHALPWLFSHLWNVELGDLVKVLMNDGQVLVYRVTEVHANVSCQDPNAPPMPNPPLALVHAPPGCVGGSLWTAPTDHERLTLQTSQGLNRNWGEYVVVALPAT